MYKFGIFQLDEEAIRLIKNNKSISMEPQIFNTLLFLIKVRHRVVTKEDLLEEIWHGRPVTDYVITRIIYQLRKILDDEKNDVSYIRTVRGKGYQFIGAVEETDQIVNLPLSLKKNSPWKLIVTIFFIILFSLFVFRQIDPLKTLSKTITTTQNKAPTNRYPVVVVLPIEITDANEELSTLTQTLIDYLTNQLAINLNMKVIHPDNLIKLNLEENDIWSIQNITKADYIIQGFLEGLSGSKVNIHLNLYKNNENGELVPYDLGAFGFPFPKSSKDLNDFYKQRKVTVRNIIKLIKPGIVVRDNGKTETDDPEAYRLVIAAHRLLRNDSCDGFIRSEKLLLKAVERDQEFAYAYYLLFANYFKRIWLCGHSTDYHKKALQMAAKVESLAPNSYHAIEIGRNTILVESNQVEQAFEYSQNADENDAFALYRKVYSLRYAGFLQLASDHIDRVLYLDPFFFSQKPIQQAPHTLLYQGRYSEYLALLAEPGNAYHDYYRGFTYLLEGQLEDAKSILKSVVKKMPNDMFGLFSQAVLHIINKDMEQAILTIQRIVDIRTEKNHFDGEMNYKITQLFALAGDRKAALFHLQKTIDLGFFPFNYFSIDPALKQIRLDPLFDDIIIQAMARHQSFAKRFNLPVEN
jgi:DNA-binding winged helix-turn-helix (wHTH) protein/TolB-like protein/Tfp pilus assembly protein PilF